MSRPFHPGDPGTTEPAWLGDPRWDTVPPLTPTHLAASRVVVLAAHPDDETLAVGALVADLAAAGTEVVAVVATDGAASHPHSALWSPERLAQVRREEFADAVDVLAPGAAVHHLDLPDGGLGEHETALRDRLTATLGAPVPGEVILAPHDDDGHVDHDTLGRVAADLARERGSALFCFPIWLWQWATPDEFPWDRAVQVYPTAHALHRKAAALTHHRSQTGPLSPLPGDEALLPPHVLLRFARVTETLLVPPGVPRPDPTAAETARRADRTAGFDVMLESGDDPWNSTSRYERRKHALTVALLPDDRYGEIVEIGCATGALTTRLADVADHVTAIDGSAAALAVARRRDLPHVTWVHAAIPDDLDLPDGHADLVLVSEVAYFLTGPELLALTRRIRAALAPHGRILFVDWREGSDTLPLDGGLVHAQLAAVFADLPHRLHLRDDSIDVDLWGGPPITPADLP